MANKLLQKLATKVVKEVKENIQKLLDRRRSATATYEEVDLEVLDVETLKEATRVKAEIDALISKVTVLQAKYKPLREEILDSLPGDKEDKVEAVVDNIRIKKYTQIKGAGKVDTEKMLKLARKKKILQKVTKQVRVIDNDALMAALAEGLISYDEYVECLSPGNVIEHISLEKIYPDENTTGLLEGEEVV